MLKKVLLILSCIILFNHNSISYSESYEKNNSDLIENEKLMEDKEELRGFIFSDSDKNLISAKELNTCDKFTLTLARNELFARKGHVFKTNKYIAYYNNMVWYEPNNNLKNSYDALNNIEKTNLRLINDKYECFNLLSISKDTKIQMLKDLNNDEHDEKISVVFKQSSVNSSFQEYHINIDSNGKHYELGGAEVNLHNNIFVADFDVNDDTLEFYLTSAGPSDDPTTIIFQLSENGIHEILRLQGYIYSYDGNGNIYTEYCFTSDKNQRLLSYYNLNDGVQHPSSDEIIGKKLQYGYHMILFRTPHVSSFGFSCLGKNYDKNTKQFIQKTYKDDEIVKITSIYEKLKIIEVDYAPHNNLFPDNIINLPIKVETEDGLIGWLLQLNGGD